MFGRPGWDVLIVLLVVLLLFGAKRLPDLSRSLGRSLRIFKAETKGLRDDDTAPAEEGQHDTDTADTAGTAAPRAALPPTSAPSSPSGGSEQVRATDRGESR
jgi:sec-independent protein translocase protein TatA